MRLGIVNGGDMSILTHRPRFKVFRQQFGFTLIELLITMALIAVLAAIAMPSFREFNIRMQVTDTTNDLIHDFALARTESVKRGRDVVVEAAGSGWVAGWTVEADGEVISEHPALDSQYNIESKSTGGGSDDTVTFRPTGSLGDASSFDLNVCRPSSSADATQSRRISITGSGIISSRRDVTGSPAGSCS